jgi:hypothetical protein
MSRGKQGVFTFVAVMATVAAMAVVPAFAVTTSGSVAATDDRAPEPVSNVQAFLGADGVEVSWDLSTSDFIRQSPTGTDFTAGGSFANVNDVTSYNVWRSEGGLEAELVGTVSPGETLFVDELPVGSILTYSVTAADGGGNESAAEAAAPVSLGDPGIASITPDVAAVDFGEVAIDEVVTESFTITNDATADNANLSVSIAVDGAGFSVSDDLLTLAPGASASLDVSFSAVDVGNLNGAYAGLLTIRTNDPNNREIVIDLSADIVDGLAAPDIDVTPLVLTFSSKRLINTTGTKAITLANLGGLPLTGAFTVTGAAFSASASSAINRPGGTTRTIDINFTPTTAGTFSGSVVFETNDPDEPTVTVALTGGGVLVVSGTGTIPTTVTKATVTFTDSDNLDFNDEAAVADFILKLRQDLAALLGVDISRITNVTISQGSVVATFTITKTAAAGEPTATEALALLTTAVADTTTDSFPSLPAAEGIVDASEDVVLQPLGPGGEPVLGWFTRSEDLVGFNDFFAFADNFGLKSIDSAYDDVYDIFPVDSPDGDIGFDDFFLFADNFGTAVDNADEIRTALE